MRDIPLNTFEQLQDFIQEIMNKFKNVRYHRYQIEAKGINGLTPVKFVYFFDDIKKTKIITLTGEFGPRHSFSKNLTKDWEEWIEERYKLERKEEKKEKENRGLDLLRTLW